MLSKLLKNVVFFLLPLAISWLVADYLLHTKPFISTYTAKKYFIENRLDSIETLFLGSSHTLNAIDATAFDAPIFNFANVSQTLYYDKELTLKYLPSLPKLKTVVINLSYFSFFYELEDITEHWRTQYYQLHYGIKPIIDKDFNLKNYSALALYQPKKLVQLIGSKMISDDAKMLTRNGSLFKYFAEEKTDSLTIARVKLLNSEIHFQRRKEIENHLNKLIDTLSKNNIKVILISTPVHELFIKHCNKEELLKNEVFIKKVCTEKNVTYFNYLHCTTLNDQDFANCDHLNREGAKKFSLILANDLSKIK